MITLNLRLDKHFTCMQITEKSLKSIFQLSYLEDLVLVGCLGIDDDGLAFLNKGHTTLKVCYLLLLITFPIHMFQIHALVVSNFYICILFNLLLHQALDISNCQKISHTGLTNITRGAGCLKEIILAYGSAVSTKIQFISSHNFTSYQIWSKLTYC